MIDPQSWRSAAALLFLIGVAAASRGAEVSFVHRVLDAEGGHTQKLPLDRWHYIQIDDSRTTRFFGLAMGDLTGDGYQDVVAGQWFYRNPGGNLSGKWERVTMREGVDAVLIVDVNGNDRGDVIGLRCDEQYWLEATDRQGSDWKARRIGSLPICDHKPLGAQCYGLAQIVPGGTPEIVLGASGVFCLRIPDDPEKGAWPSIRVSAVGQGYASGDFDGDGLVDIAGSVPRETKEGLVPGTRNVQWNNSMVCWWKNPGGFLGDWQRFDVGVATHADRFAVADFNGDGRLDIAVSEERYPGSEPNANLQWFEQPADPRSADWPRHLIVTQTSMNNLDAADMDGDGDVDLITCEHKMPAGKDGNVPDNERLQIWENDGQGRFVERRVEPGKESHLGARVADLDGDGDLDIVSIAWRNFRYLHVWRNDAIRSGP